VRFAVEQQNEKEKRIDNTPRMNDRIRITPIRVVGQDGTMLGEMATSEALRIAAEAGLD